MAEPSQSQAADRVIQLLRGQTVLQKAGPFAILQSMGADATRILENPLEHWSELVGTARAFGFTTSQIPQMLRRVHATYKVGEVLLSLEAAQGETLARALSADTFQRDLWSILRDVALRVQPPDDPGIQPILRKALEKALANLDLYSAHQVIYLGGLLLKREALSDLTAAADSGPASVNILLASAIAHARAMAGDAGPLREFVKRLNSDAKLRVAERGIMARYYQAIPRADLGPYLLGRSLAFPYDQEPEVWRPFFSTLAKVLGNERAVMLAKPRQYGKIRIYMSASVRRDPAFNFLVAKQLEKGGLFEVTLPQEFTPNISHEKLDRHFVTMCDIAMQRCDALLLLADVYGRDCATEVQLVHDLRKPVLVYVDGGHEKPGYVAEDWMVIARFTKVFSASNTVCRRLKNTPILADKVEFIEGLERLPKAIFAALQGT